jgi:hypothetical protein
MSILLGGLLGGLAGICKHGFGIPRLYLLASSYLGRGRLRRTAPYIRHLSTLLVSLAKGSN